MRNPKARPLRYVQLAAVMCAFLIPSIALSQPRGPGGGPLTGMLFNRSLDLTAEQVIALRTALDNHKTALTTDMTALHDADKALKEYLKAGTSDATQIASLVSAITSATETLKVEEASAFVEGYAVLTDTQKAALATLTEVGCGGGEDGPPPPPFERGHHRP